MVTTPSRPRRGIPIYVCIIGHNSLAKAYLADRLTPDKFTVIGLQELMQDSLPPEASLVFLFDLSDLAIPLSRCVRALQEKFATAKQVVLLEKMSDDQISGFLELGIGGFLEYNDVESYLTTAIKEIAAGDTWLSPSLGERMRGALKQFARRDTGERSRLTIREFDIVQLARCRLSNKEIASILGIRQSTVKFHLANIFNKLNISTRDDLLPPSRPDEALATFLAEIPSQ